MRGKRAKQLRKLAEEATIGQPEAHYGQHIVANNIVVRPDCTRHLYRGIKKGFLAATQGGVNHGKRP